MMPMPVRPPPVQQARWLQAPLVANTKTVQRELRPMPPPASRIDQRPVTTDRWGHMAGLGADTERLQVQAPNGSDSLVTPIVCGVIGYFVFSLLSR